MMKKIFRVIKASIWLTKAFDLASHKNYLEGMGKLREIDELLYGIDEEFHILKSLLLLETEEYEESIENGEVALGLIANNDKLNASERVYLKIYIAILSRDAYISLGEIDKAECEYQNCIRDCMNEGIDVTHVADRLKKNFPLHMLDEKGGFWGQ